MVLDSFHLRIHLFLDNIAVIFYLLSPWRWQEWPHEYTQPVPQCALERRVLNTIVSRQHTWKITWIKGHTDDPGAEELRMFPDCYYEVQQAADILARDALPHQHYPCGLVDRWFARVQLAATTQAMLADWWVYRKQVDPLFGGCDISTRTNMPTEDDIYQGLGDDNEPQLVYFGQEEEDQFPFDICDLDGNPILPTIPPPCQRSPF